MIGLDLEILLFFGICGQLVSQNRDGFMDGTQPLYDVYSGRGDQKD
jgi:hypothetical protein